MAGAADRNKGSLQYLVGEVFSLYNRELLAGKDPVDLMHKVVNACGVYAAPLVAETGNKATKAFQAAWGKIPAKPADGQDEDLFHEGRRYSQLAAFTVLFYNRGILALQDVPTFESRGEDDEAD